MRIELLLTLMVVVLVAGCTASRAEREACYAKVNAEEHQRAFAECPGPWETCEARPRIIADAARARAGCP